MKKFLMNIKGFTLVELMVVVAIIGILSSIAVPNFKKYQAKAKQSEAKIQLAAIYQVEVSAQADYNTFATCLTDLGYEQAAKGYYAVGFSAAVAMAGTVITTCSSASAVAPAIQLKGSGTAGTTSDLGTGPANFSNTFTATAAGQISTAATGVDKWTVNEGKSIVNSVPVL